MSEIIKSVFSKTRNRLQPNNVWWRILITIIFTTVALSVILFLFAASYVEYYRGQVYPGVKVGKFSIGELTGKGVSEFIENVNNRYAKEGLSLQVKAPDGSFVPVRFNIFTGSGDDAVELVRLDAGHISDLAIKVGRGGSIWQELVAPLYIRWFGGIRIRGSLVINDSVLKNELGKILAPYEDEPHNAGLVYAGDLTQLKIQDEKPGLLFNLDKVAHQINDTIAGFSFEPIQINSELFKPTVSRADVEKILPNLDKVLGYGPLGLNYVDPQSQFRRDWVVDKEKLASWLEVVPDVDNKFIFSLNQDLVDSYLDSEVRPRVDVAAIDAKFAIDGGKVREFQASRSGVALDAIKTYTDLAAAFKERNYSPSDVVKTVNVTASIAVPKVKTADVNDLGITDVIGVGVSTFKDSHTNRIKNIANAVARLNGVLVKPDEEFSANKYAGPYTRENGFLPEQVIKGNEIKPEVGGGMCQIGTTLFRMAMNSGMDITQRRNHSLVVSYYADPVNGNPGTDATLYEPLLDLKFKNDTGNYLLLQTDIDYKRQQLTFTLWGKPDGRKGWYTHPLVSKWIPAGDPVTTEVSDGSLKPGVEKCQGAFKGAVASFTYSRVTPVGDKIDRVFDSYYRPLPKICLVGAASSSSTPASASTLDLSEPGQ